MSASILPPSAAGVVANAALPLMGRVSVNLNYTLSHRLLNRCIELCGIRHVITSRRVMERLKLEVSAELIYLEDLAPKATLADKVIAAIQAKFMPLPLLERQLGVDRLRSDDVLTVIFTSGSTGDPKGVMLTHGNVGSNIWGIGQIIRLTAADVAIGVLPFFHSYGYTAALWTVLALDPKGVYHISPLDAREVGKLCREHGVTLFMATPTFLRNYMKRCPPEDFKSLELAFAAAEKCPADFFAAFEQRYGIRPLEAYGCTELSPLVSANIPPNRAPDGQSGAREGTVGRPIPGVRVKVVEPETGAELPPGQAGMLLVAGPGVMKGYLNQPELTAKVIRDGWYVTGDLATIDADGFITITGRESRFSKIGGEMVPHGLVEETLQKILGSDDDNPQAVRHGRARCPQGRAARRGSHCPREIARGNLPRASRRGPAQPLHPLARQLCAGRANPSAGHRSRLDLKGMRDVALGRVLPKTTARTNGS